VSSDCRFLICIKEKLLNIYLMRTNYVPVHSPYYAESQYISYVGGGAADRKETEFIGNKQRS